MLLLVLSTVFFVLATTTDDLWGCDDEDDTSSCNCRKSDYQFRHPGGKDCVVSLDGADLIYVEPDFGARVWHVTCRQRQWPQFNVNVSVKLGKVSRLTVSCPAPSTSYLDLTKALGIETLGELEVKLLENNNMSSYAFEGLEEIALQVLTISGFHTRMPMVPILNVSSIKEVTLRKWDSLSDLSNKPFIFLHNLTSLTLYANKRLANLPADLFARNRQLTQLSLTDNSLTRLDPELFSPLVHLQHLDLSANLFNSMPSQLLQHNVELNSFVLEDDSPCNNCDDVRALPKDLLKFNHKLETFRYSLNVQGDLKIPRDFFVPCASSLRYIVVSRTLLDQADLIPLVKHLGNVTFLDLSKNRLQSIKQEDIPVSVTDLYLSDNVFDCQCQTLNALAAFHLDGKLKDYLKINVSCLPTKPGQLGETASAAQTRLCHPRKQLVVLYIVIGVLAPLLVLLFLVILLCRPVKVWLYNNRVFNSFFPKDCENINEDGQEFEYDVFISYANEDEAQAHAIYDVLANDPSGTHERTFQCCIHERDFLLGDTIPENIVRAVSLSRRTLILLSKSFLQSPWCTHEFAEANSRQRVVIVMLDNGLTDADYENHPDIRSHVKTFTYLARDNPNFWAKLIYELPHRRRSRRGVRQRHATELQNLVSGGDTQEVQNNNHS